MQIIPISRQGWSSLFLFPFKTYTVVGFPLFFVLDHGGLMSKYTRSSDAILIGYLVAGFVLLVAGLAQKYFLKTPDASSSFVFAGVAIFIGVILMPMFAPL